MSVTVELMNVSEENTVPSQKDFEYWGDAVLNELQLREQVYELGIRLVSENESAELNKSFRRKQGATNVLSFTYPDLPDEIQINLLGDLAICSAIVIREAQEQQKSASAHWAHMTVHGMLHLLGHDHQNDTEAQAMETLECRIMSALGYPQPYPNTNQEQTA